MHGYSDRRPWCPAGNLTSLSSKRALRGTNGCLPLNFEFRGHLSYYNGYCPRLVQQLPGSERNQRINSKFKHTSPSCVTVPRPTASHRQRLRASKRSGNCLVCQKRRRGRLSTSQSGSSLALPRSKLLWVKGRARDSLWCVTFCQALWWISNFVAMASNMDYSKMNRKELQALCKQHKIPANKTNVFMAEALDALLNNAPRQQEEFLDEEPAAPASPEVEKVVEKVKGKQARMKVVLPDPEIDSLADMLAQSSMESDVVLPEQTSLPEKMAQDPSHFADSISPAHVVAAPPKARRGRPRKVDIVVDAPMAEVSELDQISGVEDKQLLIERQSTEMHQTMPVEDQSDVPLLAEEEPRAISKAARAATKYLRGRKKEEKVSEAIPSLSPPASHVLTSPVEESVEVDVTAVDATLSDEESMEGIESALPNTLTAAAPEATSIEADTLKESELLATSSYHEALETDDEVPAQEVVESELAPADVEPTREEAQTVSDLEEEETTVPIPVEKKKKGRPAKKVSKLRKNVNDEAEIESEVQEEKGKEPLPSPVEKIKKGRKKGLKSRRNLEVEEAAQDAQGREETNNEVLLPAEGCVAAVDFTETSEDVGEKESFSWTCPPSVLEEGIPVPPKKSLPPAFTISPFLGEKKYRRRVKGLKKSGNNTEDSVANKEDLRPEQEMEQTVKVVEPVTPIKDNVAPIGGDNKENTKDELLSLSMRKLVKKCKEKGIKAEKGAKAEKGLKARDTSNTTRMKALGNV
ncbi:hypothetical protein R1flu_009208 [Riccia fluitans]|uniref:Uncharacterized protein n=1 Tax=Riccia fluitans TaxID=41844 RepID=A0ABD1Z1F7_9MARC